MKIKYLQFKLFFFSLLFIHQLHAQSPGGVSTSLVSWYKANAGTNLSGSRVTQWNDQTAGARNLVTFTSSGTPTHPILRTTAPYLLNYNPTLEFDNDLGTYQLLRNATRYFAATSPFHIIVVSKDLETTIPLPSRGMIGMGATGYYPDLIYKPMLQVLMDGIFIWLDHFQLNILEGMRYCIITIQVE